MRALVIDTALDASTAAVWDGVRLTAMVEPMARGGHERIAGLARRAMAEAGLAFADLDRVGVTVGPGSFTGLRVGLAFALGLGEALGRPVIGLESLNALAASVEADGPVLALIDARRGQVYGQSFCGGVAQNAPRALGLDEAADMARGLAPGLVLVGSGAPLIAEAAPGAQVVALGAPSAEALIRLTLAATPEAAPARPMYLRAPDATPSSRRPGAPRTARPE